MQPTSKHERDYLLLIETAQANIIAAKYKTAEKNLRTAEFILNK